MEVVYSIMLSEKSRIQKGLHKNRKAHAQNPEEIHKNGESVGMVALWVIFFFFCHFQNRHQCHVFWGRREFVIEVSHAKTV